MSQLEDQQVQVSEAVLTQYGLAQQPFDAIRRPEDYVLNPALEDQLNLLVHNLRYGDHLLVLKGAAGSGKTSLLMHLIDRSAGVLQVFVIRGHRALQAKQVVEDLLKMLAPGTATDKLTDIPLLGQLIASRSLPDVPVVMAIDDAECISPHELATLLHVLNEVSDRLKEPLKIMLIGCPHIEGLLSEMLINNHLAGKLFYSELSEYDAPQTEHYLEARLKHAGLQGELPLSHEAVQQIAGESQGCPAQINRLAANMLNQSTSAREMTLATEVAVPASLETESRFKRIGVWSLMLLGLAMVFGAVILFSADSDPEQVSSDSVANEGVTGEVVRRALDLPEQNVEQTPVDEVSHGASSEEARRALPVAKDEGKENTDSVPSKTAVNDRPSMAAGPESSSKDQEVEVGATAEAETAPNTPSVSSQLPGSAKENAKPQSTGTSPAVESEPASVRQEQVKQSPQKNTAKPSPIMALNDRETVVWLKAQNPRHFSVQLIASRKRQVVEGFMARHKIPVRHGILRIRRGKETWFILLAGAYPDAVAARKSVARLPAEVRANGPWVRSLMSIQGALSGR